MGTPRDPRDKIISRNELGTLRAALPEGTRVVFTNGCFDLLHAGHVDYLHRARALGDLLVVGVNSDASVRRIKGPRRPVTREEDRTAVLAGLESVDQVVLFAEETPLELIKSLQPDVLVKGGDWPVESIVGRAEVQSRGGLVLSLPFREGYSTTGLIDTVCRIFGTGPAQGEQGP